MREIIFYRLESGQSPAEEFLDTLTDKQFKKVAFVFDLVEEQEKISKEYFKKLVGTDEIWEERVQSGNDIFRFLGFMDKGSLVILNHAFVKKTLKTPKKEILIAEKRKKDYENRR